MDESLAQTRDFGLRFARLIAGMAVDPHGGFEKKYTSRIEAAKSAPAINSIVAELVQWADSPALSEQERTSLNRQLDKYGMPSIAELRHNSLA